MGALRGEGEAAIRWSTGTDCHGPTSVLDIDGNCPPELGAEIEEVLWSALHPDDRLQRDWIGVVCTPGKAASRSEALALAQLLIDSHLMGAFDGAFEP